MTIGGSADKQDHCHPHRTAACVEVHDIHDTCMTHAILYILVQAVRIRTGNDHMGKYRDRRETSIRSSQGALADVGRSD